MSINVTLDRGSEVPKCNKCLLSLMGREYLIQESQKFCVKCYEDLYCNTCHTCGTLIGTGTRDISYEDYHFHDGCFSCNGCDRSLTEEKFIFKDNQFICGKCYEENFSPKCTACKKPFKPGVKRMQYKEANYHEECFCCSGCGNVIGKRSFVERVEGYYCEACFETRIANKCAKCKQVIKVNGVAYRDETYHSSCLRCGGCNKELAGQQLITQDQQAYCLACHADKFAKKCQKCKKPITGIGGTKMIAFEDYNWHVTCFTCAECDLRLEGEGFIMHENTTYCQDCAKQF